MKNETLGVIGTVIGAAGFLYAICVSRKLDRSIDELANMTSVDIADDVITKAVNKAVDREVNNTVVMATRKVITDIESDIKIEVKCAVTDAYSDVRKSVSEEISKQAVNIDIGKLKADVIERSKQEISDKLDGQMDEILETFNHDLEHISTIYSSIARNMTKNNEDRGMCLKIS